MPTLYFLVIMILFLIFASSTLGPSQNLPARQCLQLPTYSSQTKKVFCQYDAVLNKNSCDLKHTNWNFLHKWGPDPVCATFCQAHDSRADHPANTNGFVSA